MLILLLHSANRDEKHVPEPDRFLLDRPEPYLPFGYGVHYCLGAALARLEARVSLEVLTSRIRQLTRRPGPPEWSFNLQFRALERLQVEVVGA